MIPKIEVFVRHCHFSAISHSKKRFETFSKQRCFENLMRTADFNKINLTFFLDTFYPTDEKHFVTMQNSHPVITISEGTETGSFLKLLDHVQSLSLADDTIIYFLEDDYIHKEGWADRSSTAPRRLLRKAPVANQNERLSP